MRFDVLKGKVGGDLTYNITMPGVRMIYLLYKRQMVAYPTVKQVMIWFN
jgi:hypothetical protein